MTRTKKTRNMMRERRRSSSRRREMVKPTLLSGISMQAPVKMMMMMMTSHLRELLGCHQGGSITLLCTTLSYGKRRCKGIAR